MKKTKYIFALILTAFIFLWNQEPPEGMGMTNQFIGTYACETNRQCYFTVYSEGNFYYYDEGIFCYKGYFREFAEDTYELAGKKIKPQRIAIKDHSFQFLDSETELNFKKINEIPIISVTVKELAE